MEKNLNKLQIRAKVFSVLSEIKQINHLRFNSFSGHVKQLEDIEDKDTLFDILFKELCKAQDLYLEIIVFTISETIPKEVLKDKILSLLSSKNISDDIKYHLIQILKDSGTPVNYDKFFDYFDNPDAILNYDTQKLLEVAVVNPETQIDFLDFLMSLPDADKLTLINSLYEDYEGDNLANILIPILPADFSPEVLLRTVEILGETKSSIAIPPIKNLMEDTKDVLIKSACKKSLNMLKLSGASELRADGFYKLILSESKVHKCYTTIPDGHYNQGFIIIRRRESDMYQMFALVASHIYGIVDCFGFNYLAHSELQRIIDRFCKNDPKIEVPSEYCKTMIDKAVNLSRIFSGHYSYEFACWSVLAKDFNEMNFSIEDWIESNIETVVLDKNLLKQFYKKDYIDRWFFTIADNEPFRDMVDELLSSSSDIASLESKVSDYYNRIWDAESVRILESKIINTVYLINLKGEKEDAAVLYSLIKNQKYLDEFKMSIIKKSIYEHFMMLKQNIEDSASKTNIFKFKNIKETDKEELKKIKDIIKIIEKYWVE